MRIEEFRKFLDVLPFRPFVIHTAGGESIRVRGREMIFNTGGRLTVVSTGKKIGDDEEWKIIDIALIDSVTIPASPEGKSRKRSA